MALIKLSVWREQTFAKGSEPSTATLIRWIKTKKINGKIIGGLVFVEADCPYPAPKTLPGEQQPIVVAGYKLRDFSRKKA